MSGVTHTYSFGVKVPGLPTLPADPSVVVTGDYCIEVEVDVIAGAVSQLVHVGAVTKTKVISLVINADKANLNIFTNAADGTGGQAIVLTKNASLTWNNQLNLTLFPNPIGSATITDFYLNNPGTVNAVFRASFLMQVP